MAAAIAAAPATAPKAPTPAPAPKAAPPVLTPRFPRILVLDFTVQGDAAKDLARTLADVAVREITRVGGYKVLSQADVMAQLGVERQRTFMGCGAESSCLAEIAGAIDADRTLTGSVTMLGESFFVTAKVVDARKIAVMGGAEETIRSSRSEELVEGVRRVVFRALTGRQREAQAVIEFDVPEVAARVLLDGVEIGRGPFQDRRRVSEGNHRVVVVKEGYAAWENAYRLEPGERAHVAPQLVAIGGGRKLMGWSSLGAGVAAVALGGYAVYQESQAKRHYSSASGMLGPGGILPVSASAQAYQDALSSGRSSHQTAVVSGVAAGVAVGTSLVLGYLSYTRTGEIGPFRF
jgi:TolB-like protein